MYPLRSLRVTLGLAGLALLLLALISGCAGPRVPTATPAPATHVVVQSTAFYRDGPQQSRPPDGTLDAGTRVTWLSDAGSYVLVRVEGQADAVYVAADSIRRIEP